MFLSFVLLYMGLTLAIGAYASSRVHNTKDFMIAGRSLPLYMSFACVFATWFGAETVLSVSSTFVRRGLRGISGDPFGATTCLLLVAFFFSRTFYRMQLLTIGDYYRVRYGRLVEFLTSAGIAGSYLGWTTAQLSALGIVIHVLFPDVLLHQAILLGSVIVTAYTVFGGMWSVALTDVVQSVVIVIGLVVVAALIGERAGGIEPVLRHAYREGHLDLLPPPTLSAWLGYLGAFVTMSLGSVPQQDVFQRVTSAKDERTAFVGTLSGGLLYFVIAFIPMFIAYSGKMIDPVYAEHFQQSDTRSVQKILPMLILNEMPFACKALFFGALLSAILSTASGTMLAPASLITENVLSSITKRIDDTEKMWLARYVLIAFSVLATSIAMNSTGSMYEMVEGGYKVTLVVAFVPLLCGIYWSRATAQGAILSILVSVPTWLAAEFHHDESSVEIWRTVPPQLYGLAASFLGMGLGSLLPSIAPAKSVAQ